MWRQAHAVETPDPDPNYAAYLHLLHGLRGDWAVRTEDPNTASLFLVPAQS